MVFSPVKQGKDQQVLSMPLCLGLAHDYYLRVWGSLELYDIVLCTILSQNSLTCEFKEYFLDMALIKLQAGT